MPRAIRVGPNQGRKKIRVQYRGFIGPNTKIPGVYQPKYQNTGGLSDLQLKTRWFIEGKKKSRDKTRNWGILADKPPVLGKFRSTPGIEPKFLFPLVSTYPDGARQRRRVAPRRRAPP